MFYYDGTSDFMQKDYIVDQIRFVVRFSQDGKEIYIATPPVFSSLAAQMLCGEMMAPLHWQPTGKQIKFLLESMLKKHWTNFFVSITNKCL